MQETGKLKPKISLRSIRYVLLSIVLLVLTFGAGYWVGHQGYQAQVDELTKVTISREKPPEQQDLDFSLFWRVWDTLDAKYYDTDKLVDSKMVYGAIRGMVAAVDDPYTVFLPPQDNKVVQEDLQGNFEGVGIQIGFKGNQLAVISPLPDSPAESAGIQAGDFIVGIKDLNKNLERGTVGITLPEAVQAIRGQAGTKVTLTLLREGLDEPFQTEVVRQSIVIPSIVVEYVGENENIAHVQVIKFSGETFEEWNSTVAEIQTKPNVNKVIMDVRNNPGGYLQGAVELASDFLENGEVVVIEEERQTGRKEFKVEKIGRLLDKEVVVLVNEGSASASEIFAGALRDNKQVQLIGDSTFGKGTIQQPEQMEGGVGLHITVAKWLTPSGYWVNEEGLIPDVQVENNPDTTDDEQLVEAIRVIQSI